MNIELERIAKMEAQLESIKEDIIELKSDIKEIHSRVTTNNREIVDKIDDMQTRIEHRISAESRISQEQPEIIRKEVTQEIDKIKRDEIEKIKRRITDLEQWKWYVIGAAVTIGFILGNISEIAKYLLK